MPTPWLGTIRAPKSPSTTSFSSNPFNHRNGFADIESIRALSP
jgi:hypothetical protein